MRRNLETNLQKTNKKLEGKKRINYTLIRNANAKLIIIIKSTRSEKGKKIKETIKN